MKCYITLLANCHYANNKWSCCACGKANDIAATARIMQCAEGSVKTHLSRALANSTRFIGGLSMTHKWNDERLAQVIRQSLDVAEQELDSATRQRLYRMRQQALQPRRRLSQFFTSPSYSWVTASIGLVTLSLILWGIPLQPEPKSAVTTAPLISQDRYRGKIY